MGRSGSQGPLLFPFLPGRLTKKGDTADGPRAFHPEGLFAFRKGVATFLAPAFERQRQIRSCFESCSRAITEFQTVLRVGLPAAASRREPSGAGSDHAPQVLPAQRHSCRACAHPEPQMHDTAGSLLYDKSRTLMNSASVFAISTYTEVDWREACLMHEPLHPTPRIRGFPRWSQGRSVARRLTRVLHRRQGGEQIALTAAQF